LFYPIKFPNLVELSLEIPFSEAEDLFAGLVRSPLPKLERLTISLNGENWNLPIQGPLHASIFRKLLQTYIPDLVVFCPFLQVVSLREVHWSLANADDDDALHAFLSNLPSSTVHVTRVGGLSLWGHLSIYLQRTLPAVAYSDTMLQLFQVVHGYVFEESQRYRFMPLLNVVLEDLYELVSWRPYYYQDFTAPCDFLSVYMIVRSIQKSIDWYLGVPLCYHNLVRLSFCLLQTVDECSAHHGLKPRKGKLEKLLASLLRASFKPLNQLLASSATKNGAYRTLVRLLSSASWCDMSGARLNEKIILPVLDCVTSGRTGDTLPPFFIESYPLNHPMAFYTHLMEVFCDDPEALINLLSVEGLDISFVSRLDKSHRSPPPPRQGSILSYFNIPDLSFGSSFEVSTEPFLPRLESRLRRKSPPWGDLRSQCVDYLSQLLAGECPPLPEVD
jgi:hypothetical protein